MSLLSILSDIISMNGIAFNQRRRGFRPIQADKVICFVFTMITKTAICMSFNKDFNDTLICLSLSMNQD